MQKFNFIILSIMIFLSTSPVESAKIFVKSGNIYLVEDGGRTVQLTHSGQAHSPVLSPDENTIAFLKTGTKIVPEQCRIEETNSSYGDQIWILDIPTKKERLLVDNHFACDKPTEIIVSPHDLTFSLDNKTLYFLTDAWTTSNALHVVNIADGKQHYLLPANSVAVSKEGEYKGHLILNQHRYFIGGGSYDWYWLFTPEGKEVGPLGEEVLIK